MAMIGKNKRNGSSSKIKRPLVVIDDFSAITEPKSDLLIDFLEKLKVYGKVLIILDNETGNNLNVIKAAEEIRDVNVVLISELESDDIRFSDYLVLTRAAIEKVTERL